MLTNNTLTYLLIFALFMKISLAGLLNSDIFINSMSFRSAFANALGQGIAQSLAPLIAKELGLDDSEQFSNAHIFANPPSDVPATNPSQQRNTARPQKHRKPTMQIRTKSFYYKTFT